MSGTLSDRRRMRADPRPQLYGCREVRGFTYIAVLIFVAIMGVGLAAAGEAWHTVLKREKEQELLFAGHQFRNALAMYYNSTPGQGDRYPTSLEDLLKDPRYPGTKRYLRKIYLDPVTNSAEWQLIKGPNGEIMGVRSSSEDEPLKNANFSVSDQAFEGQTKYSEWVFAIPPKYLPASAPDLTNPSGTNSSSIGSTGVAAVPRKNF